MTTWPDHLTTKTVDVDITGPGTVVFTGPVITVDQDNKITLRVWERVVVGADGQATVTLPATNAAGVLPASWEYTVTIRRGDQIERGSMQLDKDATAPVKLTSVLQLGQNVDPGVSYIPLTQKSVAGGVAALDVDGDVTDASGAKITGGGGGGASPGSTVVAETTYGQTATAGTGTNYSRSTHTHGTPALPTAADVGAAAVAHNHTGTYQPLDGDLTAIAALTPTTDNVIQSVAGAWASRTPAQARAALTLLPAILLGPADSIPGGTPTNTLVVRTT